jgi:hypothetical protein
MPTITAGPELWLALAAMAFIIQLFILYSASIKLTHRPVVFSPCGFLWTRLAGLTLLLLAYFISAQFLSGILGYARSIADDNAYYRATELTVIVSDDVIFSNDKVRFTTVINGAPITLIGKCAGDCPIAGTHIPCWQDYRTHEYFIDEPYHTVSQFYLIFIALLFSVICLGVVVQLLDICVWVPRYHNRLVLSFQINSQMAALSLVYKLSPAEFQRLWAARPRGRSSFGEEEDSWSRETMACLQRLSGSELAEINIE